MKFQRVLVVAIAGLGLTLGGCTGGNEDEAGPLPPVEIPALTPEPQPFRTGTSFVDGVLSIDVPTSDGRIRTLDTVLNLEWTSELFLPRPVQPDHSSREWILANNHYGGRVFLYALVSWNDADPTDYLAAGWWLTYPPDVPFSAFEAATRGVFLDGPELDPANPPDLPLTGTASYSGGMGGLYTYSYGRAWASWTVHRGHGIQRAGLVDCRLRAEPPHRMPRVSGANRNRARPPSRSRRAVGGGRSGGVASALRRAL